MDREDEDSNENSARPAREESTRSTDEEEILL